MNRETDKRLGQSSTYKRYTVMRNQFRMVVFLGGINGGCFLFNVASESYHCVAELLAYPKRELLNEQCDVTET